MKTTSGWLNTSLGELLALRYGKALPPAERAEQGPVPVLGSAGRMTGTARALVTGPALVIGRKGNIGSVQRVSDAAWPIDTTFYATVPGHCDLTYLALQLEAANLAALDSSTATPSLRRQDLAAVTLTVPPLREQRRTVEILEDNLSCLYAAASQLRAVKRRLARLEEQTLRHGLAGGSLPRATATLPAANCDDGRLADLPAGWSWRRLQDVATVVGGVTKDAKKQSDPDLPEWPYLRVANVQRGRLDLSVVTRIRVAESKAESLFLRSGDVLLNEGGDRDKLGRGWIWEGQIERCIHQNHVFRARVLDDAIEPRLLSWAANSFGGPWCERNGEAERQPSLDQPVQDPVDAHPGPSASTSSSARGEGGRCVDRAPQAHGRS